jgi:uncharacterized protein YeaO (DUF488 family)
MPPVPLHSDDLTDRFRTKRVYRQPRTSDGKRILVDRLWPRGVSKERARLHSWVKEIAPSNELREWFHENPDFWEEFRDRYMLELGHKTDLLSELATLSENAIITFVYASRNEEQNNAVVLLEYLHNWMTKDMRGKFT